MSRFIDGTRASERKARRGEEEDMPKVDFNKLGIRTLKRYKRRYKLKVRHNPSKTELATAVGITLHFTCPSGDTCSRIFSSALSAD
jgi:hypothetical protein